MITARTRQVLLVTVIFAIVAPVGGADVAQAATGPIKEVFSSKFGWDVNRTKVEAGGASTQAEKNVCTVASKDVCQRGVESSEPGGLSYPKAVAVDNDAADIVHHGHVYVADTVNNRVQELAVNGEFVSMFGWNVNRTKVEAGGASTQAEKNVCTEEEIKSAGAKCQTGVGGPGAEMLDSPARISVDPVSGTVYVGVGKYSTQRVVAYTSSGKFLWMTAGFNSGAQFEPLTAGGSEHLLYVGGEGRVQELEANGKVKREVTVGGAVSAIAVDGTSGDMYVMYNEASVIHHLGPDGKQVAEFAIEPDQEGGVVQAATALALDSSGHLVVSAREVLVVQVPSYHEERRIFGSLYLAATGHRITELSGLSGDDMAFNDKSELFSAATPNFISQTGHEVLGYKPVSVGELVTKPAECKPGTENETDETFDCNLNSGVDQWGVSETEVWFQYGFTPKLGTVTEPILIPPPSKPEGEEEPMVDTSAPITGLKPKETIYYRLVGHDHKVKAPELLTSETSVFSTKTVPPKIVAAPTIQFVKSSSAVMYGQLNPENANTRYEFRYAPATTCKNLATETCPGVAETASPESAAYAKIGVTLEANGLQPGTPYRYGLFAVNQQGEPAVNTPETEGEFTTAPAPSVTAQTGGTSAIGATNAVLSGTVNPDGLPATYSFELGIYRGAETQYGVVLSGPVGTSTIPIEETLALNGLQPGTEYAYRITIHNGYGTAQGSTDTFTTTGLPSVLPPPTMLPQLPIPKISFPAKPNGVVIVRSKCKRGYTRDKHGKCVRSKPKKKTKKTHKAGHRPQ